MDMTVFAILLLVGLVAGWAAGLFVRGAGFGIVGDMAVGVVGANIGGWLFISALGIEAIGLLGLLIAAIVGAVVVLVVVSVARPA